MTKKKNIIFITDTFPLGRGETFIESEIPHWGKHKEAEITIIPLLAKDDNTARSIPENCSVDGKLFKTLRKVEKRIFVLFPLIFLNPLFWQEIRNRPGVILSLRKLRKLVACSAFSFFIARHLTKHYKTILKISHTLVYTYWFYYGTYGAVLLKRKAYRFRLITRAHGTDVFQNRKDTGSYIPFRTFPIWQYIEQIYPVSMDGMKYLKKDQSIPEQKLTVAYLGINSNEKEPTECSCKESLKIVSCSYIAPVKRIDHIINAIAYHKKRKPTLAIEWTHMGDGALMDKMLKLAEKHLKSLGVKFNFKGFIKNSEVLNYYSNNKIDCFITTSESEGFPVSIMEALCSGIPVISTPVGGIPEFINNEVGCLLPHRFSYDDISKAFDHIMDFKTQSKREEIAEYGKRFFNGQDNFSKFIEEII